MILPRWVILPVKNEILQILKRNDVPCSRLPAFSEVCNDAQLSSRNDIIEVEQAISGKVKVPGSIFKLSKTPWKIDYPAPFLGQHNHEVLSEMLGYTEEDISHLADEGVV